MVECSDTLKPLLIIKIQERAWNEHEKVFEATIDVVADFDTATEAEKRLAELKLCDSIAKYRIVRNDELL